MGYDMKKISLDIHHYQVTALAATLLVLYVLTFLAGYFWGKKSALEEFSEQIQNESFSDKVYASLCSMYDAEKSSPDKQQESVGETPVQTVAPDTAVTKNDAGPSFIGQLVGYGTEKQAQQYVKALARKGVKANMVTRTSVSSRGKKRVWYQVVTAPASYADTQKLVERLAIEDRLAGVTIIESNE